MPRKKRVGCTYCFGSKLSDEVFRVVLASFVAGLTAGKAAEAIAEMLGDDAASPSDKTINRHYQRIGLALYERFAVQPFLKSNPQFKPLKDAHPEEFDALMDYVCERLHGEAIDPYDDKNSLLTDEESLSRRIKPWALSDISSEYRKLSSARYGIKATKKEHLGLLAFKELYFTLYNRFAGLQQELLPADDPAMKDKLTSIEMTDAQNAEITELILDTFKDDPC